MEKQLKMQLQDAEGKVLKDQVINVNDNDLLIVKIPSDATMDFADWVLNTVAEGLENGGMIGVPSVVDFVLVKKEKQSLIQTAPSGLILP